MRDAFLDLIRGESRGVFAAALRLGLCLVSFPYGWAVRLRNLAYSRGWKKTVRARVPVISVGNLTLGGTGKTPCVEHLARRLRQLDRQVAILSRGYGTDHGPNDEALVLEENCPDVPHLQGPDRAALAQAAAHELESDVLLLDDGFQHRRLHRDLDIVLIDATNPWGHGWIFPRGLLREPKSGLRRAHLAMITRCGMVDASRVHSIKNEIATIAPNLPVVESDHRPAAWVNASRQEQPVDAFRGKTVAAFCGLGNPGAFRRTLETLGCTVAAWRTFPDHHGYTREDVDSLRAWAAELPADTVIATTQKDLVKIRLDDLGGRPLWALRIELAILHGEESLDAALASVLK